MFSIFFNPPFIFGTTLKMDHDFVKPWSFLVIFYFYFWIFFFFWKLFWKRKDHWKIQEKLFFDFFFLWNFDWLFLKKKGPLKNLKDFLIFLIRKFDWRKYFIFYLIKKGKTNKKHMQLDRAMNNKPRACMCGWLNSKFHPHLSRKRSLILTITPLLICKHVNLWAESLL